MAKSARLGESDIRTRLAGHPRWKLAEGKLRREFVFTDFSAAWGFMNQVALLAEKSEHHPDWSNTWNKVVIELSSHDVKGLSQRDFDLAAAIDKLAPA